ncbi:hypothetical protein GCM10020295_74560 [Streptomyces cinereospinus]
MAASRPGVFRKSRTAPTAPGTPSRRTGRRPKYVPYEGFRPAHRERAPDIAGTAQDFRNTPGGDPHARRPPPLTAQVCGGRTGRPSAAHLSEGQLTGCTRWVVSS